MKFSEYQQAARRTQNHSLMPEDRRNHALFGLAGEVGEIQSIYQKFYQGHVVNQDALRHEIGDLLWFIAELCDVYQWDISDIARENIEKLRRRYPRGFSEERSINREESDT